MTHHTLELPAAAEAFSDGIIFFSEKADRGLIVSKDKSVKS